MNEEFMRKREKITESFKFWNGVQFGLCVAMFLTVGTRKLWLIAGGLWVVATIIAGIRLQQYHKLLKNF